MPGGEVASEVDLDLEAWERGDLDVEELERRHPDEDVRALTDLHARLTRISRAVEGRPTPGWAFVETRLDQASGHGRGRFFGRSLLVAALVAVLGGATASATEGPALGWLWHGFFAVAGGEPAEIEQPEAQEAASGGPGPLADESAGPPGVGPALTGWGVEIDEPDSSQSRTGDRDGRSDRDGDGGATGERSEDSAGGTEEDTSAEEETEESDDPPTRAGQPLRAEGEEDDPGGELSHEDGLASEPLEDD